jgi:hypothetical protein
MKRRWRYMRNKKLSIVLPLTAMISTGIVAPTVSFAAANDNSKIIKMDK